MPPRSKIPYVPKGNPTWRRLTNLEAIAKDHETRLSAAESDIRDISRDQALMGNIVIRSLERVRRWAPPLPRRRR